MRRAPLPARLLVGLVAVTTLGLAGPAGALAAPAPARPDLGALVPAGSTPDGWEAFSLPGGAVPASLPEGLALRAEVSFVLDGLPRSFRVVVPLGARRPAPVLLALHGLHETPDAAERTQQWEPLAREHGFVLVQGIGHAASWNAGTCCGEAATAKVDDVRYLDRVLQVVQALHPVDPRRVHVTGFSNGAMMAYRYACQRRGRIAAVLAVAGTVTSDCRGRADVAVLHVHGMRDRTVPLEGLAWSRGLASPLRPVSRTTTWFGPRVEARLLARFGHGWPTTARGGYATSRAGWSFLEAHPRRSA